MVQSKLNASSTGKVGLTSYGAFIAAAVGASIGLGNIWKFPYESGLHGGGMFLAVYLFAVLLVAFPLIMAESMLGRLGRGNPVQSMRDLCAANGLTPLWQMIAWLGLITSVLVFSFYSVVAGWTLYYILYSVSGAFVDMPAEFVKNSFGALLSNQPQLILWHSVFVLSVVIVLAFDIRQRLERLMRWLMPIFLTMLGLLIWMVKDIADLTLAYRFMFTIDWQYFNAELVVAAISQALFSLSVGMGIIIMYGAYLSEHRPLFTGSVIVTVFDTLAAILTSVLIFSIVFAYGLQPNSGVGLIFESLPVAFSQMPEYSVFTSTLFFSLVYVAALFSGFALLEPSIVRLTQRFKLTRRQAAWLVGLGVWLLGLACVYSFNHPNQQAQHSQKYGH